MSFNIRYLNHHEKGDNHWKIRKERTMAAIQHFGADIIGTQEAYFSQIRDMQPVLTEYERIGIGRDDGAEAGETCSIFFRKERFDLLNQGTFWLSDTPEVIASSSWGNKIARICTWSLLHDKTLDRQFYVFNCHFDHRSQKSREQSARLVAKKIAERKEQEIPFVLLGDFNAGEDNPVIRYFKGETVKLEGGDKKETSPISMVDSFRVLNPETQEVATGHGFTGRKKGPKIDYVLIPQEAKVEAAAIDHFSHENLLPSDHYPVTATISFPPRK